MIFAQIPVGMMANFVYVIGCEKTKKAAVVDPSADAREIHSFVEENGLEIDVDRGRNVGFDLQIDTAEGYQLTTASAQYDGAEMRIRAAGQIGLTGEVTNTALGADAALGAHGGLGSAFYLHRHPVHAVHIDAA